MVNSELSEKSYIIQAGVTEYPIGFEYHFNENNSPQLLVKIGESVAIINVDFQLSSDGSKIILIPTEEPNWMDKIVGKELLITRDIPLVQASDYSVGRINPEQIEYDFDNAVMRDQMLADEIDHVQGELDLSNSRIDVVRAEHARDMAEVDRELSTKATKTELGIVKNTLNSHTNELTTLSENQASLGSRVSGVEEKIPGDASATNQLVAKDTLNGYVKKSGDTITGRFDFNVTGDANANKALIGAQTANGLKALFGAKTDENGFLRDVAIIPKLQGDLLSYATILTSFIGNITSPVTRIHAKKITSGGITDAITIPASAGTMARIEDINAAVGDISTALTAILGE